MQFEWDLEKRQKTLAKHGLDFARCSEVFAGPTYERRDDRTDYGEDRYIVVGVLDGNLVLIVYTPRGDDGEIYRIISMRPATKQENEHYAQYIYR